jgi:hypothetical protein
MRLPKYVPQHQIRYIADKLHVSTPDTEVAQNIRGRLRRNVIPRGSFAELERKIDACVKFAVHCHHENQALYLKVMRGVSK